jgi:hypothetical protein
VIDVLEKLIRAYECAEEVATALRRYAVAAVEITWFRITTSGQPQFVLRCQHCREGIRPAGRAYADRFGCSTCAPESDLLHHPMPVIR